MSKWSKICYLLVVLSFIVLFVLRFILGGWVDWFWGFFIFAGVALAFAIYNDWRLYLEFMTMRTTKHGANMGVLILMSLALVVASNYLGFRFNKSLDVTEEKLNSLSDQSMRVLNGLKEDVLFTIFYAGADDKEMRMQVRDDLSLYTEASPKVKMRFVNARANPGVAKEYLADRYRRFAVFVEQAGRRVLVEEPYSETTVTSAIIKATRTEQKTIYFVTGHGEPDIDQEGEEGLSVIRKGLGEMSFNVAKLNLTTDTMPGTDSVIAVVGSKTSFLDAELDKLTDFARKGGRLLIAVDPGLRHNLANLTRRFGVEFKNNYILTEQLQQFGLSTIGAQYDRTSQITSRFGPGFLTFFYEASEIARATEAPTDWTYRELVKTEGAALIVNDPRQRVVESDAKARVVGALVEAPLKDQKVEKKENEESAEKAKSLVIIFGDSDFIADRAIFQMGNRDLALNVFADLAKESELTGIRPKQPKGSTLVLTRPKQYTIIAGGVGLPVILLVMSGFFWFRRRNL